jgi:cell division protein FtsI (penicillin-binding protein 3)
MKSPRDEVGDLDLDWPKAEPRDRGGVATAKGRTIALAVGFCAGFALLSARAVQIGLFRPVDEAGAAARAEVTLPRADIVDRNGVLLATSLSAHSLYADPKRIWDPVETARALRTVFPEMDEAAMVAKLSGKGRFVWIARRLTPRQKRAVWELAQPGLEFVEEPRRVYPMGALGGHVIGMVKTDGGGVMGIERALNDRLTTGDGATPVALSLDARVQHVVESELDAAARLHRAIGGAAIVMDVETGEVLSAASWPFADPNAPGANSFDAQVNRVTNARYEMGSTFKVFTVAVGLEDKVVTPDKGYDATAPLRIGEATIHDFHGKNRVMSVQEILSHSSNIGTVRIARDVGTERMRQFFERVGLMERSGGELMEAGAPLTPRKWSSIAAATASFGHGIAVSPLAVTAAYAAVSNGGRYVRPTFLARTSDAPPPATRQVLSPDTSATIVRMMREVVTEGTGGRADVEGYEVAGKTGTAEKAGPNGYDVNRRVSSFAGMFPANKPRYAILVLLDEPKGAAETGGVATAGVTAAPVVSRIVARSAHLLGVRPSKTFAQFAQDATPPQNAATEAQ